MYCFPTSDAVRMFAPKCLRAAMNRPLALSKGGKPRHEFTVRTGEPAARPYRSFLWPPLSCHGSVPDKPYARTADGSE